MLENTNTAPNGQAPADEPNPEPVDRIADPRRRYQHGLSHKLAKLPPPMPLESEPLMAPASPPPPLPTDETSITRELDRGSPGDDTVFTYHKTPEQKELARKRSRYYEDVFAQREPMSSARERVTNESFVMADIKTNVIISDEFTFITDLSYFLSQRYQRPENSVIVTITHSACLMFAGNFDPAYTMTITALPSQVRPVTNKRNALLIGKSMEELLGVKPSRGLLKFVAVSEENMAIDGQTIAGEIEDLERAANPSLARSISSREEDSSKRKNSTAQSLKSLRNPPSTNTLPTHVEQMTPPLSPKQSPLELFSFPFPDKPHTNAMDRKAEKVQKMGRRRSFMAAVFGKA